MRYFLSASSRSVAERLAAQRTLCAFDFDGTLAPIVAQPGLARMRAGTRRLLACLAALYPTVVISGRARRDLAGRLAGLELARIIGNHGAETGGPQSAPPPDVGEWLPVLAAAVAHLKGVWIEDKGYSLAVHYRQSVRKTEARRRILAAVDKLRHVRTIGGKLVINLLPADAPDKGTALTAERDSLGCDSVLYVGDDDNDEDAFALKEDIVAVRIGRSANSRAPYYLRRQTEIDALIHLMLRLCHRD